MGSAMTNAPVGGSWSRLVKILEAWHVRRRRDAVHDEVLRRTVVDRRDVHTQRRHPPLLHEHPRRGLAVRGEVQVGRIAGRIVPEVRARIRPATAPAGAQQHDRPRRDGAVEPLERRDVRGLEPVVRVGLRLRRHVDDDGGRDQLLERDPVRREAALGEVDRRVQVRATVLWRGERVRSVEPAARGRAEGELLELEPGRRRRPVERLGVVRVRQVDQPVAGQIRDGLLRAATRQRRGGQGEREVASHGTAPWCCRVCVRVLRNRRGSGRVVKAPVRGGILRC